MKAVLVLGSIIAVTLVGISALEASWVDDWAKMEHIRPKGYVCYRATGPIKADGNLDED